MGEEPHVLGIHEYLLLVQVLNVTLDDRSDTLRDIVPHTRKNGLNLCSTLAMERHNGPKGSSDFPMVVAASLSTGGSGITVPHSKMLGHVSLAAPHGCRVESQTTAVLASRGCVCPVGQLEDRRLVPTEPPRARGPETQKFRWAALGARRTHACALSPP